MEKQLPSLMNDSIVEEYMAMLFDNGKHEEYNDTKELLKYIENLEKQFDTVVKELHDIKEQLNTMQNPTVKMRVVSAVDKTHTVINNSMNKLNDIKTEITTSMKASLNSFKQKGKTGVVKAINLLHIKEALKGMRKSFFIAMNKSKQLSYTVDAMTLEMRNVKRNLKNVGLLFVGKEVNNKNIDKLKMNNVQKSARLITRTFESMIIKSTKMVDRLENMEKKSVKNELKLLCESSDTKKINRNKNKEQLR